MKILIRTVAMAFILAAIIGPAGALATGAPATPAAVTLGTAASYAILSKAGVTTTGVTAITGNIGVSPIAASAMTGFALKMDSSGRFSISRLVTGKVFASDYATPTPSKLTTAVGSMQTAYTNAAGLTPTFPTNLHSGNLGGKTLAPGVYKWTTAVIIPGNVTLSGDANAVWVFQIAGTLNIASAKKVILSGGALAKNVFWVVAKASTLGTYSTFNGTILDKTNIALKTGATLYGRALAQTAVTLEANTVKRR